jgi:hypothetical protein
MFANGTYHAHTYHKLHKVNILEILMQMNIYHVLTYILYKYGRGSIIWLVGRTHTSLNMLLF